MSVREGRSTDEVMVNIIAHIKSNEKLAEAFRDYFPFADSPTGALKLMKGIIQEESLSS